MTSQRSDDLDAAEAEGKEGTASAGAENNDPVLAAEAQRVADQVAKAVHLSPEQLSPEIKAALFQVSVQASAYRGPIPPPSMLAGYNAILPNAAERIFKMAEEQQKHRIGLERSVVDSNIAAE